MTVEIEMPGILDASNDISPVLKGVRDAANSLPDDQAGFLATQVTLFEQQHKCLQDAVQTQQAITSKDPLVDHPAATSNQPPADAASSTHPAADSSPQAPGPPPPEWEDLAVSLFSIADTLTPTQLRSLAHMLGCSEEIIRNDYNKQRTSVRNFLQRVQKKAAHTQVQQQASDASQHPASLEDPAAHQAEQEDLGLQKLASMQDEAGAITVPSSADKIIMQMQSAGSYGLRTAQLSAVARTTSRAVLMRFSTSRFLDVLEGWLRAAEQDGQSTFLMQVVRVLAHVPLSLAVPRDALSSAVKRLLHYKSARVVTAANLLLQLWQAQDSGGGPPVDTLRAKLMAHTKVAHESSSAPPPAHQPHDEASHHQPEAPAHMHPLKSQGRGGGGGHGGGYKRDTSQRPLLSTDDIIREKQRFALLGKQWPGQRGPGAGPMPKHAPKGAGAYGTPKLTLPEPSGGAQRNRNRPLPPRPNPGYEHVQDTSLLPSSMQPHHPRQPLHPEQEAALLAQRQRHQQWAVHRQQYLSRETDRQLETLARLGRMAPSISWHAPPHIPPPVPSAPPAQGEESYERQVQRNREGSTPRVIYGANESRPATPMEPASVAAALAGDRQVLIIPFTPVDAEEHKAQNAALWGRGVRLPAFVTPPDAARGAAGATAAALAATLPQYAAAAAAGVQYAAAPAAHLQQQYATYAQQGVGAAYPHAQHQQYHSQQQYQHGAQYAVQVQYMPQSTQLQQQAAYGYYQQPGSQQQAGAYQVQLPGAYAAGQQQQQSQQQQQQQQQQHMGYYNTGGA